MESLEEVEEEEKGGVAARGAKPAFPLSKSARGASTNQYVREQSSTSALR